MPHTRSDLPNLRALWRGAFALVVSTLMASCSSGSVKSSVDELPQGECARGTYGASCALTCACSDGGVCNDGRAGDGTCVCLPGRFGTDCAQSCDCALGGPCADGAQGDGTCECESGFYGPRCEGVCACENGGACADGPLGDGSCTCRTGNFGPACAGTCSCTNGVCSDGAGGDGSCVCQPGFYGPACASACACETSRCDDGVNGTGACRADEFPALGVYKMRTDGTQLELVLDTGPWEITHVRRQPGSDWIAGTRYSLDPDGNGLAMETEGFIAHYIQTEVVVFDLNHPAELHHIDGSEPGIATCNASWTADGKLLYLKSLAGGGTVFKRASFSVVPTLAGAIETVPVPPQLVSPVDPDQFGPSDASGTIIFPAIFNNGTTGAPQWVFGIWKMPASGEAAWTNTALVGCPICPAQGGCCSSTSIDDVSASNDPRINHAGTVVTWMQAHPDIYFGVPPDEGHPYRQAKKVLSASTQSDLTPVGTAPETSHAYPNWRSDDAELVYWQIAAVGGVMRLELYTMAPDGTGRTKIPLPNELCPQNPAYLDDQTIIFTAYRCGGSSCSCNPSTL